MNRPARRPGTVRRPRGATETTGWEGSGRGRAAREAGRTSDDASAAGRRDPDRADALRVGRSSRGRVTRGRVTGDASPATGAADNPRRGRPVRYRAAGDKRVAGPRDRRGAPQPGGVAASLRRRLLRRGPAKPVPTRFRRRRLLAGFLAALVLLAGVAVGTWVLLYNAGVANVQDVAITGLSTVPEQAVRDAAAITPGGPLVAVDTAGAARRVAALEGVASVVVRRAWPHTVEVEVTERVPVALWQSPQGVFEVDGTGVPYRRAPAPPPALPRLTFAGVAPQDPSTAAALAVLHDLTDPLRAQITTVGVAGTKVTLGLGDGRSVRWGDPDRSADKIAVLGPLLGQPGTVYDVSSPDLPTVRP